MKAKIDDDGTMVLHPESSLQAYALPKWIEDFAIGDVAIEAITGEGVADVRVPQPVRGKMFAAGDISVHLGDDVCLAPRSIVIQFKTEADVRRALETMCTAWGGEA